MKKGKIVKAGELRRSRRLLVVRLRMLSANTNASGDRSGAVSPMTTENAITDFLTTGRTGRRNAMPDILGEHAKSSTSDLPEKLEQLTCSGDKEGEASTSSGGGGGSGQQQSQNQSSSANSDSAEKS